MAESQPVSDSKGGMSLKRYTEASLRSHLDLAMAAAHLPRVALARARFLMAPTLAGDGTPLAMDVDTKGMLKWAEGTGNDGVARRLLFEGRFVPGSRSLTTRPYSWADLNYYENDVPVLTLHAGICRVWPQTITFGGAMKDKRGPRWVFFSLSVPSRGVEEVDIWASSLASAKEKPVVAKGIYNFGTRSSTLDLKLASYLPADALDSMAYFNPLLKAQAQKAEKRIRSGLAKEGIDPSMPPALVFYDVKTVGCASIGAVAAQLCRDLPGFHARAACAVMWVIAVAVCSSAQFTVDASDESSEGEAPAVGNTGSGGGAGAGDSPPTERSGSGAGDEHTDLKEELPSDVGDYPGGGDDPRGDDPKKFLA